MNYKKMWKRLEKEIKEMYEESVERGQLKNAKNLEEIIFQGGAQHALKNLENSMHAIKKVEKMRAKERRK